MAPGGDGDGFRAVPHAYADEIAFQREMLERKPAMRHIYQRFLGRIARHLAPHAPTVEVGAGAFGLRQFVDDVIGTDVFPNPWLDCVADACRLPFADASVGNLACLDVLHHLPVPLQFLREAQRVLRPGGRLVMGEPWGSLWGRFVYSKLHHEPYRLDYDAWCDAPPPDVDPANFANQAIPTLLFGSRANRARTAEAVPGLRLLRREFSDFLTYPLIGGHNHSQRVPGFLIRPFFFLEDTLLWPFARSLSGLMAFFVLERR